MTLPAMMADMMDEQPDPTMSPEDVQSTVTQMLDQARSYSEGVLADFRAKATDYYKGMPFGNEVEGRSGFVVTEVKDTVQAVLPSLMEVFSGTERAVEFRAHGAEDVDRAEQATDYVNYIVNHENPGHLTRYATFKDALVRRLGIVKYWWEPGQPTLQTSNLTGVSPDQLVLIDNDPGVESGEVTATNQFGDMTLFDVAVHRRTNPAGRVCIEAVPPDEFVFSPNAKSKDDALCVAHVTKVRKSKLIQWGYREADIDAAGPAGRGRSVEYTARQPLGVVQEAGDVQNPEIDYAEVYCDLDVDGDGVAENRRIVVLGQATVVANDPFDGRPFALYCTDPEPHSIVPQSVADGTMDLQLLKSAIVRGMLDSAAQSINPGYEAVENQVNITDLMNQETGRVVRVRAPGMLRDLVTPFVGKEMFPILMWADEMKENRFGISKASMGLNPDALQSSTKAAVAATVTASQQHLKLMAMMLAEGERQLYEGVLKLVCQYQDRAKMVRLRNTYVEVDPRYWDATMDCLVNVGLGAGTREEKLQALEQQAARQEGVLKLLGPTNPLCTLGQYRETLGKIAELSGFTDTTRSWKAIPLDYEPPPAQPKPTPEEVYAQIEGTKVQADIANKQALLAQQERQMELDAQKAAWDHEEAMLKLMLEREKLGAESGLREREMDLKSMTEAGRPETEHSASAPPGVQVITTEQLGQMAQIAETVARVPDEIPALVADAVAQIRADGPKPIKSVKVTKRDKAGKPLEYDISREGK